MGFPVSGVRTAAQRGLDDPAGAQPVWHGPEGRGGGRGPVRAGPAPVPQAPAGAVPERLLSRNAARQSRLPRTSTATASCTCNLNVRASFRIRRKRPLDKDVLGGNFLPICQGSELDFRPKEVP